MFLSLIQQVDLDDTPAAVFSVSLDVIKFEILLYFCSGTYFLNYHMQGGILFNIKKTYIKLQMLGNHFFPAKSGPQY